MLTSSRESPKQIQQVMNLMWRQQKNQCVRMSNNIKLERQGLHEVHDHFHTKWWTFKHLKRRELYSIAEWFKLPLVQA